MITRYRETLRATDNALIRWTAEKFVWVVMVPTALITGWIYSVAFVAAVSIYTAYQTASTNAEAIKARLKAEEE